MIDSNSIPFLDNAVISYDFSNLVFNEYHFTHCHLDYCMFDDSEINNCSFYYSDLMGTSLQKLKIHQELSFVSCNLSGAIVSCWEEKNTHINFVGCNFDDATFKDMDISIIGFQSIVSMSGTKMIRARMSLKQFLNFLCHHVTFEEIEVTLDESDLMHIPSSQRNDSSCKKEIIRQINIIKKDIDTIHNIPTLLNSIKFLFPSYPS